MINFSELFGEGKEKKKEKKEEPKAQEPPKNASDRVDFAGFLNKEKPAAPVSAPAPEKKSSLEEKSALARPCEAMVELYKRAVILAEKIFNTDNLSEAGIMEVTELVKDMADQTKTGEQQLLECVFGNCTDREVDYTVLNLANVCVLALELGVGLKYENSRLVRLGIGAFLHDIGMKQVQDLANFERKLTYPEMQKLQKHPQAGVEALERFKNILDREIINMVGQEHERIDASGYPEGLKNNTISEYAQIIGLCDVFEAFTHDRPNRKKVTPLSAVKTILEEKESFGERILKAFIGRIGLYPKGTFVSLNTREVARVIKQNQMMPFAPVVRIIYDKDGRRAVDARDIDLSEGTKIHITKELSEFHG